MSLFTSILRNSNTRIALIALAIVVLDQVTKRLVLRFLGYADEKVVIDGFFKFVHWGNTGAAWSLFPGNNELLAVVALVALFVLFFSRHHFDSGRLTGQFALGFIFGGIITSIADQAFAFATNSMGRPSIATQFNVHFIAASAPGDELTAEGNVLRKGRRVDVCEIAVTNQDGKLIARATGTAIPMA